MIKITIKVKNDHCTYTEHFESQTLMLSTEDPHLVSMIEKVTKAFNQPVDEVIVKTHMFV